MAYLTQIAATIYMAQPLAEQAKDAVLQGGRSKGTALVVMANTVGDCVVQLRVDVNILC